MRSLMAKAALAGNRPFPLLAAALLGVALTAGPGMAQVMLDGSGGGPAAVRAKVLMLNERHNGRTVQLQPGATVEIRLGGNATTGFQWKVVEVSGKAVKQIGDVEYRPSKAAKGAVGAGGMFIAGFRAVKSGESKVTMHYRREWEKDVKPAKAFRVTFRVGGDESGAGVKDRALDIRKPGTYFRGRWAFTVSHGPAVAGRPNIEGRLTHAGLPVPAPAEGSFVETPWGMMVFYQASSPARKGWLPKEQTGATIAEDAPRVAPPLTNAKLYETVEHPFVVHVGQGVEVSLLGGPARAYNVVRWSWSQYPEKLFDKARPVQQLPKDAAGMVQGGHGGKEKLAPGVHRYKGHLKARAVGTGEVVVAGYPPGQKPGGEPSRHHKWTVRVVEHPAKAWGKTGVFGRVEKLTGNFMPMVGPGGPVARARRGRREGLSVPVHVFKGQVKPFKGAAKEHEAYLKTVQADAAGYYHLPLEPGKYTIVAEIDGKLCLNVYSGDGHWVSLSVPHDGWARWVIEDTTGAAF